DADLVHFSSNALRIWQDDSASSHKGLAHDDGAPMQAQMSFGITALALMTGGNPETLAKKYLPQYLYSITLHEVGHNFGLQHNFIGHAAYTKKELRDPSFTGRSGLSTSVMDYIPFNLAPKGAKNGSLFMTVLGPYDYYAIRWGYAPVPGAKTPEDEVPTLSRWASAWSDPRYRFASDEDTFWPTGHAIDPRVHMFQLTGDTIGWCDEQLGIVHGLLGSLDRRFPRTQRVWEDERVAFGTTLGPYVRCSTNAAHWIGGEYLSRARVGDPHAALPLTPVGYADEKRAFDVVDRYLFSNSAWNFSPATLRRLVYTEYSGFNLFNYDPSARHDISVAALAARYQNIALGYMFAPLVLGRIDDLPSKAGSTKVMTLTDLFAWTQRSIYGDLTDGTVAKASVVRRNLQRRYAGLLARLANGPAPGTPFDAQALARFELGDLDGRIGTALKARPGDVQTRAHLEAMRVDVRRALHAQGVVPAS
ncbi:MAG: zinc-dependent metalloprotease, partial [Candidatus Eremiobacteraeota bacterium]|nr:zinc-dependent metalloprotease [Candidatus Eremiobacteraeota bacterium]